MQATIESLEELEISLNHEIRCEFTRGELNRLCLQIAVVRITFKCKCGYNGVAFICAKCLDDLHNNPRNCRCSNCRKWMKPHKWSTSRIKWKQI